MIENLQAFFNELYRNFNNRNIDLVISKMTDDVKWANGMEGGFVYGHNGVKDYWTRQFTMLSARVTPLTIDEEKGVVKIKVHQVVHDLDRKLLVNEYLYHLFSIVNDKIAEFNIGEKIKD
jgi:SnoaL-like protein